MSPVVRRGEDSAGTGVQENDSIIQTAPRDAHRSVRRDTNNTAVLGPAEAAIGNARTSHDIDQMLQIRRSYEDVAKETQGSHDLSSIGNRQSKERRVRISNDDILARDSREGLVENSCNALERELDRQRMQVASKVVIRRSTKARAKRKFELVKEAKEHRRDGDSSSQPVTHEIKGRFVKEKPVRQLQ